MTQQNRLFIIWLSGNNMDLVRYGKTKNEQTVRSGFLAILDRQDPLSSESDYKLLVSGSSIPKNSNMALLRSGTLAEIELENRLYRTREDELFEVGAKIQIELDPNYLHEFMSDLIARQDLTSERLEQKLNIDTTVHKQISEAIGDMSEMFPANKDLLSEYMENEITNSLTAYGLRLRTTIIVDRPTLETKKLVERNKLEVERMESKQGIFETLSVLYSKEAEMMNAKIRASEEYVREQIQHERDMEFFDNSLARGFLAMMNESEGQNTVIQVKDGTANIHIGKKKEK